MKPSNAIQPSLVEALKNARSGLFRSLPSVLDSYFSLVIDFFKWRKGLVRLHCVAIKRKNVEFASYLFYFLGLGGVIPLLFP